MFPTNSRISPVFIVLYMICSSCSLRTPLYKEPTGLSADVKFENSAALSIGVELFEDARDCRMKRSVARIQPFSSVTIRVKAPEATAFTMNWQTYGGPGTTAYCLATFSFAPKVGAKYIVSYSDVAKGCLVQVSENSGEGWRPFKIDERVHVTPLFDEDGPFCKPQTTS